MSAAASSTTLGHALLARIHQQPRSGYDLRKEFASTPFRYFSDSPGAIYPALRRLRAQGWITPVPAAVRSGRRKDVMGITREGRRALARWLSQPVTSPDVAAAMDDILLRFAYSEEILGPRAALRIVGDLERELGEHIAHLERYCRREASRMTLTGKLALGNGIETYRAHRRWCREARRRLRGRSGKGKG